MHSVGLSRGENILGDVKWFYCTSLSAFLPLLLVVQKPFYNQSTEIRATLKESLTAIEPHLTFSGTANGFVPGRPVLEVPGWRERYPQAAASPNSNYNAMSRLRIFSGTSNPVSSRLGLFCVAICAMMRTS